MKNSNRTRYATLFLLSLTFESLALVIALRGNLQPLRDPWMWALLGLASFRGGRALAYNTVFEWLRAPFTHLVADSSGAGLSIEQQGSGVQRVIGELLCCPICTSTWVGLVLVGLLALYYPIGLVTTVLLAIAGVAEMLHWRAERDEWQGRMAREEAGTAWLLKNKGTIYPESQPDEASPISETAASAERSETYNIPAENRLRERV